MQMLIFLKSPHMHILYLMTAQLINKLVNPHTYTYKPLEPTLYPHTKLQRKWQETVINTQGTSKSQHVVNLWVALG